MPDLIFQMRLTATAHLFPATALCLVIVAAVSCSCINSTILNSEHVVHCDLEPIAIIGSPRDMGTKLSDVVIGKTQDGKYAYSPNVGIQFDIVGNAVATIDDLAQRLSQFDSARILNVIPPGNELLIPLSRAETLKLRQILSARNDSANE